MSVMVNSLLARDSVLTRKWRKAPCFSYGDISHTFVGDTPLSVIKQYIED